MFGKLSYVAGVVGDMTGQGADIPDSARDFVQTDDVARSGEAGGRRVTTGGSIREQLRRASERSNQLPPHARPTVTRPIVASGSPNQAQPAGGPVAGRRGS